MLRFLFYVILGGVVAFFVLKWMGYTTFAQVERDVRGAGQSISKAADNAGETIKEGVRDAPDNAKKLTQ